MQIAPSDSLIKHGFSSKVVLPDGEGRSGVLVIGEAPGENEDKTGIPFHPEAEAGGTFKRLMERVGLAREQFWITNCVWQRPPQNELSGMYYESEALSYWRPHLLRFIQEKGPRVILALGGTALQQLTDFSEITSQRGYVNWARLLFDREGAAFGDPFASEDLGCPVIATYHPSYLNHGQQHLSGVFIHDCLKAVEIARTPQWQMSELRVTPSPSPGEFEAFCRLYNPERHILAYDIENPQSRGLGEDVLEAEAGKMEISFDIDRMSFCFSREVGGYSIPYQEPYISMAKRLMASPGPKQGWYSRSHDDPRLRHNGFQLNGRLYDLIERWRHLNRTLPASLEFVAPFYLDMPPWKHQSHIQPEWYSAMDAVVTLACGEGMERDLRATSQWETYNRHVHDIIELCGQMARNGLPYSKERAQAFGQELEVKKAERLKRIQQLVPEALKPVKQKSGLVKAPKDLTGYVRRTFPLKHQFDKEWQPSTEEVCFTCGFPAELKLKGKDTKKAKRLDLRFCRKHLPQTAERWALLEEFNPASHLQVKALIKHFGHKPGTDRKTKGETSNNDTLKKLISQNLERPKAQEAVECYKLIRQIRVLSKVLGTYVMGWVPGSDGRIHPTPGIWGDMFRISWRYPNIAATVADKGGSSEEEQVAAGFRTCVCVADDEVIIESDWKGMEAVLVGYFAEDEGYMKLARLGVHDYMALHMIGQPIDIHAPEGELKERFKWVKKNHPKVRDDAKHTIHGCVTGEHEVLTHNGWVPFERYTGEALAQWDNGKISFVAPSHVTRHEWEGDLVDLHGRGLSVSMTPDHAVPYATSNINPIRRVAAEDLPDKGRIPVSGEYCGWAYYQRDIVRLAVAVQADSSLCVNAAVFHLVKPRKVKRLLGILESVGCEFDDQPCKCHEGGRRIRVKLPPAIFDLLTKTKQFSSQILHLAKEERDTLLEEVLHWDGCQSGPRGVYLSTDHESAKLVQTLAHLGNRQGLLREACKGEGHYGNKPVYIVSFNRRKQARLECLEKTSKPFSGMVYCVTVPSGFFLVRHRERISVTGNTNYGMTPFLMAELYEMPRKRAQQLQEMYFALFPRVRAWQLRTIQQAHSETRLVNAWGYRMPFWNVHAWQQKRYDALRRLWVRSRAGGGIGRLTKAEAASLEKIRLGVQSGLSEDKAISRLCWTLGHEAKSAMSFLPRDSGAAMLKDALLELEEKHQLASRGYLRGCAHDSIIAVGKRSEADWLGWCLKEAQERPVARLGGLVIGVEQAIGRNWDKKSMEAFEPHYESVGKGLVANAT